MRTSRVAAAGYLGLLGLKTALALRTRRRTPGPRRPSRAELANCVVVQPILGGDPDLAEALRANRDELAGTRLVWLVDTDDEIGHQVVMRVGGAQVLICPPAPPGVNPKLWKLQRALDEAPADAIFVVLDDDTRLPTESLGALLDNLAQATVATGLPAYLPAKNHRDLWSGLVQQFVDNNAVLTYLPTEPITLNGMTYAARVSDLRAMGGFTPVLRTLTDDLAVAGLVTAHGGRIAQTASPQWLRTTVAGPRAYRRIMHRWFLFASILLDRQPPRQVAQIAVLHGTGPLLLWTVLLAGDPVAAAVVLGIRAVTLSGLQQRVYGRRLHRPLLSVISELLQPVHLVHGLSVRTIVWRTRRYRVISDADFRLVP